MGEGRRTDLRGKSTYPRPHSKSMLASGLELKSCLSLSLSCPPPPQRTCHTPETAWGRLSNRVQIGFREHVSLCLACCLVIVLSPRVGFCTPPVFYFFLRPQMISLPPLTSL